MRPTIAITVVAALLGLSRAAGATSTGIWFLARPESGSCGGCHGLPQGTGPLPVLFVDRLPQSYTPGASYVLTIHVLGPLVPLAGYNLEATGGRLTALSPELPGGGSSQVGFLLDECRALADDGKCCVPSNPGCGLGACEVRLAADCPVYGPEHPDCACDPADKGDPTRCRPCSSDTIVSVQATHTEPAPLPVWRLRWTAPECGFGEVRFYVAGNSVNGDGTADPGDIWGVLPEPLSVLEAATAACGSGP